MVALKRASRKPAADREDHRGDPADVASSSCSCQKYRMSAGRDAEIDEIREAVEFGAEPGLALDHPRDAAIDAIEHRREHDRAERQFDCAPRSTAGSPSARRRSPAT